MTKENEQSVRDYGNRKKRIRRRRTIIIGMLLLVLIVVGAAYLYRIYNRNYQSYQVLKTIDNTGDNTVGYLNCGSTVVKYSKDGAVAIDKNGSLLWNGSYEMMDPIADTSGEYVVIADRDNNLIHIFDGKGAVGSITTLYDIVKVEIAATQGVIVALMEENETDYIMLYDVDGTVLGDKVTNVNSAGYPIDITLSEDGEKLVVSYLSVTKGELKCTVAFFNFGEVGQNYTDRFVGAYEFNDIIVPRVTFINNDTVCAYKENGFLIYSMAEIPNMVYEENLEGKILSVMHNEKQIGIVLQAEETSPKHLILYDLDGNKILDKTLDFEYKKIYLTDEEIIMHNDLTCLVMKLNGKVKFRYTFEANIAAFYPINNLDRYFMVNEEKMLEILLVEQIRY